jgi:hypothetical protein
MTKTVRSMLYWATLIAAGGLFGTLATRAIDALTGVVR